MDLVEREVFLELIRTRFQNLTEGGGHCLFITGEAGIGKTALVKAFIEEQHSDCKIFQGACDALFTPRPLAPLHDIIWQVNSELWQNSHSVEERSGLFTRFFREVSQLNKTLIVFEDVHWADEATLDFIKFFVRRITQLQCLFILTYRDDEINNRHPLRNVLGQLPPDSCTRLELTPLSREAVEQLANKKGYKGEDVYLISEGNPFYVNEILSSYSLGVPDNIKDSVISAYNRQKEKTKQIWELLSVIPTAFEIKYLEKFDPSYASAIDQCVKSRILIIDGDQIYFKHELFRRTIESALPPLKRISLNRKILDLLRESFEKGGKIERIIHHAKNANDDETVFHYAPLAAARAADLGSHREASKLFLMAIEYYPGQDEDILNPLYESYAYECYLTGQNREAIEYAGKSLSIWEKSRNLEKMGNGFRFLSRLWWLEGNKKNAETFGWQAIEVLNNQVSSPAKAMAFSNMSQLNMLMDRHDDCISWGEKAIAVAMEIHDDASRSHAMNNMGTVKMLVRDSEEEGIELLRNSLDIALQNSFHEHAARAYSNLGGNAVKIKNYALAGKMLDEGIRFCEARDLDSWRSNMLSLKANLCLETGDWNQAFEIAGNLLKNENQSPAFSIGALTVLATIKMRRGSSGVLPLLLEAEKKAHQTMEMQRIIPVQIALLEYEWLTGERIANTEYLKITCSRIECSPGEMMNNELAFWLLKARGQHLYIRRAATIWEGLDNPYRKALVLFEGGVDDKRKAISIVHELGADAVYEKMKQKMRSSGIKSIPRGIRKATRSNPAFLTGRELEVLELLREGLQNREIAGRLFISSKTVDHHMSSILFKMDVNSRSKAVSEAVRLEIVK